MSVEEVPRGVGGGEGTDRVEIDPRQAVAEHCDPIAVADPRPAGPQGANFTAQDPRGSDHGDPGPAARDLDVADDRQLDDPVADQTQSRGRAPGVAQRPVQALQDRRDRAVELHLLEVLHRQVGDHGGSGSVPQRIDDAEERRVSPGPDHDRVTGHRVSGTGAMRVSDVEGHRSTMNSPCFPYGSALMWKASASY